MEKANEVTLVFDSRPVNEALARITAASFCTQLNPTLEEVADLKTAVSEAVTNSIIHAYEGEIHKIEMKLCITGQEIYVEITDHGTFRRQWNRCTPQRQTQTGPVWDLPLWRHLWMT